VARIVFYGKLADRFGREVEAELPAQGCTIAALRARFPGLVERACVNDSTVGEDHVVEPGDRVDFLPPLSGG
jgi:molybdopterin converting factor small subunit